MTYLYIFSVALSFGRSSHLLLLSLEPDDIPVNSLSQNLDTRLFTLTLKSIKTVFCKSASLFVLEEQILLSRFWEQKVQKRIPTLHHRSPKTPYFFLIFWLNLTPSSFGQYCYWAIDDEYQPADVIKNHISSIKS